MGISFGNLDLLSVGVATAGMVILGFITFFSNSKSISSRFFLALAVSASIWGIVNYSSYQVSSSEASFWLLRLVLFFGVLASFFTFALSYIFPREQAQFSPYFSRLLVPLTMVAAALTLTPLIFSQVAGSTEGPVAHVTNGPGIIFFAAIVGFLNIGGIIFLLRRVSKAEADEKKALRVFLLGFMLMVGLILIFNFVLPAFFEDTHYIKFGALFLFPFVALTSYAMLRHHLLNVKVIATEILAFILSIISLAEVVLSGNLATTLFRAAVFALTLVFSVFLIKSVRKEVEQREELERLDKQLEEKNAQLDELSHFKSELLSLASHQIRSPLAAIKGFTSLIIDGSYGAVEPKVKESLAKIGRSADDLIGLINTLLDVRKVEEGKMEYSFAKTDLTPMVAGMVDLLKPLAETKKLEFTLQAPDHSVWVNADAEKLKQVIQNLTDNAIKYTPTGFVHVTLTEELAPGAASAAPGATIGTATVSVADSGVGVPAELIPHLFEEFVRDERIKKQIRGTGLGLFIARKIAEAHGGKIWAESPGEGKGSAFHVSIPLQK